MFRSRKTKTEYITPEFYKDWSNSGYEIECLGHRLDTVRGIIKQLKAYKVSENHWGLKHWQQVEESILRKWRHTVLMKDVGLKQASKRDTDRVEISYDWWEPGEEIGIQVPIFDNIYHWINDRFGLSYGSLDRAWAMAQEEKLQKARRGLA